jgi:hypothetical protein
MTLLLTTKVCSTAEARGEWDRPATMPFSHRQRDLEELDGATYQKKPGNIQRCRLNMARSLCLLTNSSQIRCCAYSEGCRVSLWDHTISACEKKSNIAETMMEISSSVDAMVDSINYNFIGNWKRYCEIFVY